MLKVDRLSYRYENESVLKEISFSLEKGNHYALIGASGSGKSTLLKLVYGLLDAEDGTVFWDDRQILGPAYHLVPGMDFIKYLAQDFDLMPYVTVRENIGRFLSNFYLKEKAARTDELLELVELREFADVKARYLSGGQMQRVALARVLALEPELLLLDEPFSHIDAHRKSKLARHLFQYCRLKGITVLFTSHTPEEALMYADEILVLKNGILVDKDAPQQIYTYPENEYKACLTGEINKIPAGLLGINQDDFLLIRPHELTISEEGFEAKVIRSYFKGAFYLIEVETAGNVYMFEYKIPLENGTVLKLALKKDD